MQRAAPVIVVAPDSFKGSLDAPQAARAMADGILRAYPGATVRLCPMADGGEGTLDALLAHGGTRQTLVVQGASGAPREAAIGLFDDWPADASREAEVAGTTALIEIAHIVGLTDEAGTQAPVEQRSTRGIGEAIRLLLDRGVRRFCLALGGSSTNDAGAGLLAALGLRLLDAQGGELDALPVHLPHIARVDALALDPRLAESHFLVLSDVDNPLTGVQGATAVFGPQKGVRPDQLQTLDAALAHFAGHLEHALARRCSTHPGAGAAGGLGFALLMLGASIEPGAEAVARGAGLDHALANADWLITGEGRSDAQTLHGKAPCIAALHARAAGVPVSLLSGAIDRNSDVALNELFACGTFSIVPGPMPLDAALRDAPRLLAEAAEQLARLRLGADWLSAKA